MACRHAARCEGEPQCDAFEILAAAAIEICLKLVELGELLAGRKRCVVRDVVGCGAGE
jgi:hypothetical protein